MFGCWVFWSLLFARVAFWLLISFLVGGGWLVGWLVGGWVGGWVGSWVSNFEIAENKHVSFSLVDCKGIYHWTCFGSGTCAAGGSYPGSGPNRAVFKLVLCTPEPGSS